ncbi:hypothetical protein [Kineosporia sp. NBRC 101731]|uniref:hypothetical protein n=1 Tax=Kineosporia sp. NBRC 101731 TaxID=3032199 RepID=UPI0024A25BB8|nr:hypothetical protein [Kineosporia sp. NBRC 101731]GLY29863.1 hypothetical protein Kisp02_32280 [Kineosporia sp. NBRC 101731]
MPHRPERSTARPAVYRSNPGYRPVVLDRLPSAERDSLSRAHDGSELYGALVPREGSGLVMRALSFESALLFMALAEPGPLPDFAAARMGERSSTLRRLILDGVLQVSRQDEFICGPEYFEAQSGPVASGERVYALSMAALRYAQHLESVPEDQLAQRLYGYGRLPMSARRRRMLPDRASVAALLGVGEVTRGLASTGWTAGEDEHWYHWFPPAPDGRRLSPRYKLYVSPGIEDAGAALASVARVRSCLGFKAAAGVAGICRPDRIVLYFAGTEDLTAAADTLRVHLAPLTAAGVSFTAAVTDDGMLSWGADPPRADGGGTRATSWRMFLCQRLAHYLVVAREARAPEPWRFAVERLRLSGIDTVAWTPSAHSWATALETG